MVEPGRSHVSTTQRSSATATGARQIERRALGSTLLQMGCYDRNFQTQRRPCSCTQLPGDGVRLVSDRAMETTWQEMGDWFSRLRFLEVNGRCKCKYIFHKIVSQSHGSQ